MTLKMKDHKKVVKQYYDKALATLKFLMFSLNQKDQYEKIEGLYKEKTYDNTIKLLYRCKQMH